MKLLFLPALLLALCLMGTQTTEAQVKSNTYQRCATMNRLQVYYTHNPALKTANFEKAKKPVPGKSQAAFRLQAIVTIPVVVHIVLPNPYIVTDADVQAQIDRLNQDFSGLNGDSTNASGFYAIRGRSAIRFCLARRTPGGQLTNGINRRASGTGSDYSKTIDPIKRTAQGGADAWNPQQYLNLWVGKDATSQGILGYADNIGPGRSIDDGVVLNMEAFGSSSCYTAAPYNRGRTATHEVGHYLGLYHIWGDDNGGCGGDDFEQLPASTNCSLPAGLFNISGQGNSPTDVGDTPNQADASGSCSGSAVVRDACATTAPGIMYQNYMDYTNDACLTAFTARQVARMEWVLENCRPELTTSPACQPPSGTLDLDAAPMASVSPGGFELSGCQTIFYSSRLSCPGSITPKFRVVNNGLSTLTSLTVGYTFNDGPAVTQVVNVNIPVGAFYVASFPAISVLEGSHTLRFFTAQPNGATDQAPGNDSLTATLLVMPAITPPVMENFDEPLALQNWAIDNPNVDFTWERTLPGRGGLGGKLSINHYGNDGVRNRDDLRSATITLDPSSSYLLSFDVAHKNYPDPDYSDSLAVFISRDCGQTFTRVYYKGGAALATAGSSNQPFDSPGSGDWRKETISLSPALLINGKIMVVFRTVGGYGNWLHLDNILLSKVGARDLRLESITAPGATACSGDITPQVTVENIGFETLTGFGVGYRINNGSVLQQTFSQTILPGGRATVALPQTTAGIGNQTLTAFTFDPESASGTGDANGINDTLHKAFSVAMLTVPPVTEGFEDAFVPAGWLVLNPNNNATWTRKTPGKNSNFALFFDNFNNNLLGQTDDLLTPFLDVAGADSVVVNFDVAHKFFPGGVFGSSNDRLTVLSTTNCGASFTPVYSKAGSVLATSGGTTSDYVTPTSTDWRTERLVLGVSSTTSGNLGLAFRNTNNFGNNIFVDNISISAVYKRDLQVVAVHRPGSFVCTPTVTPTLRLRNQGTDTIEGFKITYVLNGGTPVTQEVTGLLLARDAETTIDMAAITNLRAGAQALQFYITELTTASGTNDLNTRNDTLRFHFSVPGTLKAPVTEMFTGTLFPPANWSVLNPTSGANWQLRNAGNGNAGSAALPGFQQPPGTQTAQLVSPILNYDAADSVKLAFDLAAAPYRYATTGGQMDTLEVSVSRDCGNSFETVYKKWGADLQTAGVPAAPTTGFEPGSGDWRRELVDLSQFATQSPVIIFFNTTTNSENNLYLDNIHFSTRVVPVQLKQEGLLVFPSPFQTRFTLWHYQQPTGLQYIRVLNTVGQVVWIRQFSGNADKQVTVDLTSKSAGVYTVEMGYTDGRKNVVRRVVKQ